MKTKTTHLIGHDDLSSIPPDASVICVSSTIPERNTMRKLLPTALHIRCKDEESIQSGFDFTSAAFFVDRVSDCTGDIYIVSQSGLDGRTLAMEKAIRLIRSQRPTEIDCNEFIYQAILDEIAYRSGRP